MPYVRQITVRAPALRYEASTPGELEAYLLNPAVSDIEITANINISAFTWSAITTQGPKTISGPGFTLTLPTSIAMAGDLTFSDITLAGATVVVYGNGFAFSTLANVVNTGINRVFGGGNTNATGDTHIIWNSGELDELYGGGAVGAVSGSTNVSVGGGSVGRIVGGGWTGNVTGNTNLSVRDATANIIVGGGWLGTVAGDTNLLFNNVQANDIFGGGDGPAATVGGNTALSFGGVVVQPLAATFIQNVYGGGVQGNVVGNTQIVLLDGTYGTVFGGSPTGQVGGRASIALYGDTVVDRLVGNNDDSVVGQAALFLRNIGSPTIPGTLPELQNFDFARVEQSYLGLMATPVLNSVGMLTLASGQLLIQNSLALNTILQGGDGMLRLSPGVVLTVGGVEPPAIRTSLAGNPVGAQASVVLADGQPLPAASFLPISPTVAMQDGNGVSFEVRGPSVNVTERFVCCQGCRLVPDVVTSLPRCQPFESVVPIIVGYEYVGHRIGCGACVIPGMPALECVACDTVITNLYRRVRNASTFNQRQVPRNAFTQGVRIPCASARVPAYRW